MESKWIIPVMIICAIAGIASFSYTWSKCGTSTLLLGNGGLFAAVSGMCDE